MNKFESEKQETRPQKIEYLDNIDSRGSKEGAASQKQAIGNKQLVGIKRSLALSQSEDHSSHVKQQKKEKRGQLLIQISLDNESEQPKVAQEETKPQPAPKQPESVEVKLVTLLQKYKSDLATQTENSHQALQTLQKIDIISQLIKI